LQSAEGLSTHRSSFRPTPDTITAAPFPTPFKTTVFSQGPGRWFEASSRKATPEVQKTPPSTHTAPEARHTKPHPRSCSQGLQPTQHVVVEAPARPATPKGHPSSLAEHRFPKSLSYLHQDLRFSFVAHVAGVFDPAHHQPGGDPIGGGREGGVGDFGDLGIRDPGAGVGITHGAGIGHRGPRII